MGIAFRYRNPNEPLSRIITSLNRAREIINSEIAKNSVSAKDMDEDIMTLLNIFEPLCLKLRNAMELKTYEDRKDCMNNLGQEFEKRNAKKQSTFNISLSVSNAREYAEGLIAAEALLSELKTDGEHAENGDKECADKTVLT